MIEVDHRAPMHDGFCRCRRCKPSLVGETSSALFRIRLGLLLLTVMVGALVIAAQVQA